MGPGYPISHKESTDSEDSFDSESESIMTATTKELIDTLTETLKNINQSPTIPLPIFKGKKGEDPEDHILKVEDYFGVHQMYLLKVIRSADLKTLFLRKQESGHKL